ncbi:MAG: organic hydroperoxide resistance protein [Afipia sp.]|jgi:Ohr subfamily peroxiredoxin|nr:MAG: organic hydroperoxide resistance protein [Afipia sp.]
MTIQIDKVLYTGKTHTTGGREGASRSSDNQLDIRLSPPGSNRPGTNPEQLFAAGWSACFIGAMNRAASGLKVKLPADLAVDAEVDLGTAGDEFLLQARLNVSLPGLDRDIARAVVDGAHRICPYSKLTRGNINVELNLV